MLAKQGCCQDLGGFIELGFVRFECLGGFFFGSFFSVVTLFSVSCSFVLLTDRERERERESERGGVRRTTFCCRFSALIFTAKVLVGVAVL